VLRFVLISNGPRIATTTAMENSVPANEYHLETDWQVEGTVQEVYDVISDDEHLTDWWPAPFLRCDLVEPGQPGGVGKSLRVVTKGWLPYTIDWHQRVTETREPFGLSIETWGDFKGRGVWTSVQSGPHVDVHFDWRIAADKPLLRYLSPLLKPIFAFNHRWAMARGLEGLNLELLRRRATTPEARASIPLPPGPTWPHRRPKPTLDAA
jgi:Polyketide cyclase / dehydrase and lipid transport